MAGLLIDDAVSRTLRRWAGEDWLWGQTDCAMSVFRFIAETWERAEPLERWRGTYHSENEANRLMTSKGGPMPMFRAEMDRIGAVRASEPDRGAVGLVRRADRRMVAAISVGNGMWAARTQTGFAGFRPGFAVAWEKG